MKAAFLLPLLAAMALGQGQGTSPSLEAQLPALLRIIAPHTSLVRESVGRLLGGRETRAEYLTCDVCTPALSLLRPYIDKVDAEDFVRLITKVCQIVGLAPAPELCAPTIGAYATPVLYIVKNQPNLTNDDFCGILNPGCRGINPAFTEWTVPLDNNPPTTTPLPLPPAGEVGSKILQFTDIHLDLDYEEGRNADCPYPICCRAANGDPSSEAMTAGPFGHYRCGLPLKALDAMFTHAQENHNDTKYIFLTGDYVHSGIWLYGVEENGRHIRNVTTRLSAAFPNTPIFPLTGNHETDIVNMYPPTSLRPEFTLDWMYNDVGGEFKRWMGEDAVESFNRAGFYHVSPEPGLRLVVINTNLCYVQNFWLPYQPIDPEGQLAWLAKTLLDAEKAAENVLILGHISPGSGSCWPIWSAQYDRIVRRFAHIIRSQFYGHSHNEYFVLAFDTQGDESVAVSSSYVAPSALTDGMNSGYKVYWAEGERGLESTWEILDHETWILDLNASTTEAVWVKEFSAKETYDLTSLRPEALHDLVLRMTTNRTLFESFHWANKKSSTEYEPCENAACISGLLCDLVTSNSGDRTECREIERLVEASFAGPTTTTEGSPGTGTGLVPSLLVAATATLLVRLWE